MPIPQTVDENGHITYHLNAEQTAAFDEIVSQPAAGCELFAELLNKTPIWARNADEDWGVYEEDRGLLKIDENDGY